MPRLEIRRQDGSVEAHELAKDSPLLLGRLATNDVVIDEEGVAPIHCRISWNRDRFEVEAVGNFSVKVNGTKLHDSRLKENDVVSIGEVQLVVCDLDGRSPLPPPKKSGVYSGRRSTENRPEELPVRSFHFSDQSLGNQNPDGDFHSAEESEDRGAGMQRVTHESFDAETSDPDREESRRVEDFDRREAAARIREALENATIRRPQQQDPLRSPLVIGLSLGTILLTVTALAIWFFLSRERAQKQFDLAESQLRSGQFAEAVVSFELFLQENPKHKMAAEARAEIGTAKVEQAISGASPAWDKGLETLQKYIDENRSGKQLDDPGSPLRKFILESTDRIAAGAIEAAKTQKRRDPLAVAAEATKLLILYSASRPEDRLQELDARTVEAERIVTRQENFDATTAKIDEALAARQSLAVFRELRGMNMRYPAEAKDYRPFRDRMKKGFELERAASARNEQSRDAVGPSGAWAVAEGCLTLTRRTRARTDVASSGTAVFVVAEDCLYGVDSATGEPLWRRVVGSNLPFAPVSVSSTQPSVLVASTRHRELWLIALRTGEIQWKLPFEATPVGPPLIHEGQIYFATREKTIEQIDLQTGRSTARLKLEQALAPIAALSPSGERIYAPGEENIMYVLTRRPLACEQVVWLGHGPGALKTSGLLLRNYLLIPENTDATHARLRLFDVTKEEAPPLEIAQQKINGVIRDSIEVRGKTLFVPSYPENISAFTVSETGDEKSLTPLASFAVKNSNGPPMFLRAGPDDQMWMCSSSLRRFELAADTLLPDKQQVAEGIGAQPLQNSGESLFVARRPLHSRGVLFAEVERRQMVVQWQLSVGSRILGVSAESPRDGSVMCVNSLGELFVVSTARLLRGGFETNSIGQLPIPEDLAEPLEATNLSDGRLVVYCRGEQSRIWLPGSDGQANEQKLEAPLQAAPVSFANGLLLPLAGRLRLMNRPAGEAKTEDLPSAIGKNETTRWISAVAQSENQAVVLSETGRIARIQFGTTPTPHLEEVTHIECGAPVDLPIVAAEGFLFVADDAPKLTMFDALSLEPKATVNLEAPAVSAPRVVGGIVLVELKSGKLAAFDLQSKLAATWQIDLKGATLLGDLLQVNGQCVLAQHDGRVMWLDSRSGAVAKSEDIGQQLGFGPKRWGSVAIVGTLDGSIVTIDSTSAAAGEVGAGSESNEN